MQLSIKYKRYVETLERKGPVDPMGQIAAMDKDKVWSARRTLMFNRRKFVDIAWIFL